MIKITRRHLFFVRWRIYFPSTSLGVVPCTPATWDRCTSSSPPQLLGSLFRNILPLPRSPFLHPNSSLGYLYLIIQRLHQLTSLLGNSPGWVATSSWDELDVSIPDIGCLSVLGHRAHSVEFFVYFLYSLNNAFKSPFPQGLHDIWNVLAPLNMSSLELMRFHCNWG